MTPAFRPFLWLLLAAALFARAFVPQGYMPERTAESTIAVAICGSLAHWTIPSGDGNAAPEPGKTAADAPCAFAGLGAPALPPPPAPDFRPQVAVAETHADHRLSAAVLDAPRFLPPSTGPPPTA